VSDPKRLVEQGGLCATLLASARSDAPGHRARRHAAAALGFVASVGAASAPASAATSSTPPPAGLVGGASGSGAGAAKSVVTAVWFKVLAGLLVSATVVAGGFGAGQRFDARQRESHAGVSSPPGATAAPASADLSANVSPAASITQNDGPSRGAAPAASKASARVTTTAEPPPESPLGRELRSLDAARSALDRNDIADALTALDRYDRAFPGGVLRTEAAMLRVEALLARGDTWEARRRARELLDRDPSGPQAKRLRTILENP
jgi:hypothetical protein